MNPTETDELVSAPEPRREEAPRTRGRTRAFIIFFVVLALAGAGSVLYWQHARQFEETDDAFVEMHLNPVSPRVDGVVVKVYVENNQIVQAGEPLVDLDPGDYKVALDQAEAALAQARS